MKASTQRKAAPLTGAPAPKDERAKKIEEIIGPDPAKGTKYIPEGYRRKNLVMHKDHLYKLKCMAYWGNAHEYQIMYDIMESYFKDRKVKDIPPRRNYAG